MELKLTSLKTKRIIKRIFTSFFVLLVCLMVLIGGSLVFSSKIGDWYYDQKEFSKSMNWYELNYQIFKPDETLVKISDLIRVSDAFTLQVKYYPIMLEKKDLLTTDEYRAVLSEYITALYFTGKIAEYKEMYVSSINELITGSLVLNPLDAVIFDENSLESDVLWAIEQGEYLSGKIKEPMILSALFYQQAQLYLRIGNKEKADQLMKASDEIRK